MAVSYKKLWKLLIDRNMSKADLRRAAGIAPNTIMFDNAHLFTSNHKKIRENLKQKKLFN